MSIVGMYIERVETVDGATVLIVGSKVLTLNLLTSRQFVGVAQVLCLPLED